MKCPKCHYVSHDYLDACRKCGIDLVAFKQDLGLLVLQPGVLDLSLVLGGAGTHDLFESVDEEVTMQASDDDDFDISLDDYAEQPGIRRAPARAPRPGGRETDEDLAGMDHLTLELDSSDLPADVAARLRAAQAVPEAPPTPAAPAPAGPGAATFPGHVTIEMELGSVAAEFPPGLFQETASGAPPPPQSVPETTGAQDSARSLQLDVSHIDFGSLTPSAQTPEAASIDEAVAESADDAGSMADVSGAIEALQLQDVVLADETPTAPEEPAPEVVDAPMPTIELGEGEVTFAQIDAERPSASEEAEEPTSTVANSGALSVDDSTVAMEADEALWSDMPDVVEPGRTTLDEPPPEDRDLLPSFEFGFDTLAEAEATLSDLAVPTLDETSLTPADASASSDMFELEDLETYMQSEHITLELSAPTSADLEASLLEDAARTPAGDDPETTEANPNAGAAPGLPAAEALTLGDFDDLALSEHLTLELDTSEMMPLEDLPDDVKSKMSPADDQGDDEEELLLDLDDFEFNDDKPV